MKIYVAIATLCFFSSIVLADPILDEVLNIDSGDPQLVEIKTKIPVGVNIELITNDIAKALECNNCLHLSHKLLDGHISQTNSSSIGVGFIKVQPEEEVIQVLVSHSYPSKQKIRIVVKPAN